MLKKIEQARTMNNGEGVVIYKQNGLTNMTTLKNWETDNMAKYCQLFCVVYSNKVVF
jgi:hypothetical protein